MPSHSSVAKSVREDKEKNPNNYCPHPRCLWRVRGIKFGEPFENPCRNHPLR